MGKCMTKEELFAPIRECYGELREALKGSDLDRIRQLTLEVHAMVHPGGDFRQEGKDYCGLCSGIYDGWQQGYTGSA